jgi:hypothetical protein
VGKEENDQSLSYIDLTNEVNVPSKKSFVISSFLYGPRVPPLPPPDGVNTL